MKNIITIILSITLSIFLFTSISFGQKDNNKKAEIRVIYIIGKEELIIRKEVKFENTENWKLRNEYNYKR